MEYEEEKRRRGQLAAGVTLFTSAAMYSGGAAERRLGELARDKKVIIAKFPGGFSFGRRTCRRSWRPAWSG
jgi:aryl-alcohol dehydrogenase-like predicted oxidoreductase